MQADYALCRNTMRACHEAHPTGPHFTVLRRALPDYPARNVCHGGELLEDQGFLRVDKLHAITGYSTFMSVQWIRVSHPLAAKQFPDKAERPTH